MTLYAARLERASTPFAAFDALFGLAVVAFRHHDAAAGVERIVGNAGGFTSLATITMGGRAIAATCPAFAVVNDCVGQANSKAARLVPLVDMNHLRFQVLSNDGPQQSQTSVS